MNISYFGHSMDSMYVMRLIGAMICAEQITYAYMRYIDTIDRIYHVHH